MEAAIRAQDEVMINIIEKAKWAEEIHQTIVTDTNVKIIRVVIIHAQDMQVHRVGIEEANTAGEETKDTMIGNILLNPISQASIVANKVRSISHQVGTSTEMVATMEAKVTRAVQGVHHRQ